MVLMLLLSIKYDGLLYNLIKYNLILFSTQSINQYNFLDHEQFDLCDQAINYKYILYISLQHFYLLTTVNRYL